jgi:hypothetical protein
MSFLGCEGPGRVVRCADDMRFLPSPASKPSSQAPHFFLSFSSFIVISSRDTVIMDWVWIGNRIYCTLNRK